MEQNRILRENFELDSASATQTSYVAANRSALSSPPVASWLSKARIRRGLMWGIISTVLSAIGLIGLALFEQYNGMLSELRADLKHFNETSADYVKKEKLQKCWDRLRECTAEIAAVKEAKRRLEEEVQATQRAREEDQRVKDRILSEIQRLRERVAYVEGLKGARPNLQPDDGRTGERDSSRQP